MTPYRANRAAILKAHVTNTPAPWTIHDLSHALGCSLRPTQQAVHDLREIFGLMDDITLVCEPNGRGQPWLYWLVGRPDDSAWWEAWTVLRLHVTAETAKSVLEAALRGIDRRTVEARSARVVVAAVENVIRTLDALTP
jgi:hypothetical protein